MRAGTAFLTHFDRVEFLMLLLGFEFGNFGGDGLFDVFLTVILLVVLVVLVVLIVLVRSLGFTP
jgi:hypothetical protein